MSTHQAPSQLQQAIRQAGIRSAEIARQSQASQPPNHPSLPRTSPVPMNPQPVKRLSTDALFNLSTR